MAERDADSSEEATAHPSAIERILFARVELWFVFLLLLIGCLLAIGLAWAALKAERGQGRFGAVYRAALTLAEIPDTAKAMLKPDVRLRVGGSYRSDSRPTGWAYPSGALTGPDGYILFSRYDGTDKRHKLELVSLPSMRIIHSWTLDAERLFKGVTYVSRFADQANWKNATFREIHPLIEDNGDLIIKDFDSPLFRVDACGRPRWVIQDAVFHHTTEADAEGNLWIPSVAERPTVSGVNDKFRDEMISEVSPSGKLLFSRSVAQILIRHGYANWLFTNGMYQNDATHLNDIQPVLADGPYWKKGDLFISLRNVSAIMLYRPATDEIVWMKRGPWMSQHDVDILDDHRISVYDNAAEERFPQIPSFASSSQIMIYDFSAGTVTLPLERAMRTSRIHTRAGGLFTLLPDGSSLVEDEVEARFIIFRPDGRIGAEYTNRAKDGWIYTLGWSRYIDKATGDVIVRNLQKVKCNA